MLSMLVILSKITCGLRCKNSTKKNTKKIKKSARAPCCLLNTVEGKHVLIIFNINMYILIYFSFIYSMGQKILPSIVMWFNHVMLDVFEVNNVYYIFNAYRVL